MKIFAKIAILGSLVALLPPALRSQEPNTPSSTPQSESGAAPPPSGQSATPAQAPGSTQQPSAETAPQNPPSAAPLPETPEKPVLKRTKKKTAATHTPSGKVVVRNGGVKDDSEELAPAMSKEQAQHSRESTAQLLASTDRNLKNVAGRQFSPAQQNMLEEIHTYVRQSKGATESGDLDRAHTLAYKALLLSGELTKK
jgi:type IV secretory pathway VirB10-like protein